MGTRRPYQSLGVSSTVRSPPCRPTAWPRAPGHRTTREPRELRSPAFDRRRQVVRNRQVSGMPDSRTCAPLPPRRRPCCMACQRSCGTVRREFETITPVRRRSAPSNPRHLHAGPNSDGGTPWPRRSSSGRGSSSMDVRGVMMLMGRRRPTSASSTSCSIRCSSSRANRFQPTCWVSSASTHMAASRATTPGTCPPVPAPRGNRPRVCGRSHRRCWAPGPRGRTATRTGGSCPHGTCSARWGSPRSLQRTASTPSARRRLSGPRSISAGSGSSPSKRRTCRRSISSSRASR